MAKKKQKLPDLFKQDILTPIDLSTMGTNDRKFNCKTNRKK